MQSALRYIWIWAFLLSPFGLIQAQEKPANQLHFFAGIHTGMGIGWWIHSYGEDELGVPAGYARTHFIAVLAGGGELGVKLGKWEAGVDAKTAWLDETDILESSDRRRDLHRVEVSERWVTWQSYHVWLRYAVVQKPRFRLAPHLGIGTFALQTLHPDADRFRKRLSWEVGIDHEFSLSRLSIFFRPRYSILEIWPEERRPREKHKIFGLEAALGLRYRFF